MWPFARSRLNDGLGPHGERLAKRFLKRRGLKILATNYRCPAGEADLIVLDTSTQREIDCETIVLVEVKTRTSNHYTDPESAVNADKQKRLRKVANYYLSKHRADDFAVRFDIVSIVIPNGDKPHIRHLRDAF